MQERHIDRERYFEEQARTTEMYYLPYICKQMGILPSRVLEVGCGEGGNLLPFARLGCDVVGVDLSPTRIAQAQEFFEKRRQTAQFIASDIFALEKFHHRFPLIIVHDVIEHIVDKDHFLNNLKHFLAPGGIIFLAFPAWQMPFGGHQQIARGKVVSHLPFIHLLPSSLYRWVLCASGEQEDTIRELLEIKETQCTIEQFLDTVACSNYRVIDQQLYFIDPHYETKFGLKPRKLNRLVSRIPHLRNYFCTSCFYLLKPCCSLSTSRYNLN